MPHARRLAATMTLAQALFPLTSSSARQAVERFRVSYEQFHGPTDITRRYTSIWPADEQRWMIAHETKAYFDGLPPFAKAWVKSQIEKASEAGRLDDVPDDYLRLFLSRQMRLDPPQCGFS